jgi:hypothetical protein
MVVLFALLSSNGGHEGGHLTPVAIGIAVIACLVTGLMFYRRIRR